MILDDNRIDHLIENSNYPSPHNTQPIKWKIKSDGSFKLLFNEKRWLKYADPSKKDLQVTIGAALESLTIAASRFKLKLNDIEYFFEDNVKVNTNIKLAVTGKIYEGGTPDHLLEFVKKRKSWRGKFLLESDQAINEIKSALLSRTLYIITDRILINQCAQWYDKNTFEFLKEKNYQKELYEWLRFLKSHPDYNFDGLNADCLNLSSLLAKLGHVLYNPKIYEKFSSSFLAKLLSSEEAVTNTAPFLSVFINPPSKAYIDSGRQMFRDWLRLTALGYYGAPISSLTDNKETSKKLLNSISHKSDDEIIFVMRCGRPNGEIPQSGRLSLDRIRF